MVVGPAVVKFTYLATTVEVTGRVTRFSGPGDGDPTGDAFDLDLDPDFQHLTRNTSGDTTLHCETYPFNIAYSTGPVTINRYQFWPLPQKPPGTAFRVFQASTNTRRNLQVQDHVRIRGRLLIENGHPRNTSMRGWLQVGRIFPELHPIDWTDIRLVEAPPDPLPVCTTAVVVAPLYEMVYSGSWSANKTAGVADHLFIDDNGNNVHSSVTAQLTLLAGPRPAGMAADTPVEYTETVVKSGVYSSRVVSRVPGGIRVEASAIATENLHFDGVVMGNIQDPARDRAVFLAHYEVRWPNPNFGHLWHSIRHTNGDWSGLGDVNGEFAIPGPVRAVAAAAAGLDPGEIEFVFATEDGHLWHTVRRADGTWSGLGDVNGEFAIPGPVRHLAATRTGPGEVQLLFATGDGHLWHTVRRADGTWSGLGDVNGEFAIPGPVTSVAALCTDPGDAQFVFATEDGHLWHTVRRADGTWSGLGDVNGEFAIPGLVRVVTAAGTDPGVAQFAFVTGDGHLWHTVRRADGTWSGLGDVNGEFAIPGPVRSVAACGADPGVAQFVFVTEDGHLWHTVRRADGTWGGLGDVNGEFAIPGPIRAVSATRGASDGPDEGVQFLYC